MQSKFLLYGSVIFVIFCLNWRFARCSCFQLLFEYLVCSSRRLFTDQHCSIFTNEYCFQFFHNDFYWLCFIYSVFFFLISSCAHISCLHCILAKLLYKRNRTSIACSNAHKLSLYVQSCINICAPYKRVW